MRDRLALIILTAATNCACSQGTLSFERAASLITGTDGFKREAHFTIQTGVPLQSAFKCLARAEVERMPLNQFAAERGWVRYEARETILGFGTAASCPTMVLTPTGQAASAAWTRGSVASSADGSAWAVPIGRRELLGVTNVSTAPDESMQVEFDWKWMPNETGTALRSSVARGNLFFDQRRTGRASCRRTDGEWRCQLAAWTSPADAGEFQP